LIPSKSIYPPLRLINSAIDDGIDDGKLFFYNYLASDYFSKAFSLAALIFSGSPQSSINPLAAL